MTLASTTTRLAFLVPLLLLSGCNSLNPLCGSARPAPVLVRRPLHFGSCQGVFRFVEEGGSVVVDDDLVMHFTKQFPAE
jgi:hypothetical protein